MLAKTQVVLVASGGRGGTTFCLREAVVLACRLSSRRRQCSSGSALVLGSIGHHVVCGPSQHLFAMMIMDQDDQNLRHAIGVLSQELCATCDVSWRRFRPTGVCILDRCEPWTHAIRACMAYRVHSSREGSVGAVRPRRPIDGYLSSVLKLIAMQLDACGVCCRRPSVCEDRWGRVCMQLLGV